MGNNTDTISFDFSLPFSDQVRNRLFHTVYIGGAIFPIALTGFLYFLTHLCRILIYFPYYTLALHFLQLLNVVSRLLKQIHYYSLTDKTDYLIIISILICTIKRHVILITTLHNLQAFHFRYLHHYLQYFFTIYFFFLYTIVRRIRFLFLKIKTYQPSFCTFHAIKIISQFFSAIL